MNRFDLDPAQALGVHRRMSQHASTQICVVAEAVINHHAPVKAEAKYFVFKAAHG